MPENYPKTQQSVSDNQGSNRANSAQGKEKNMNSKKDETNSEKIRYKNADEIYE